jgi:hypothetical protein
MLIHSVPYPVIRSDAMVERYEFSGAQLGTDKRAFAGQDDRSGPHRRRQSIVREWLFVGVALWGALA